MHRYIIKRLLLLIPIIIGVSFLVYFIVDLTPGDITGTILGQDYTIEQQEALREELGLNDPLLVRYLRYMGNLIRGDMGYSYVLNKQVSDVYFQRLPNTLLLAVFSVLLSVVISIPLGVYAAVHENTWADTSATVVSLLGMSMPNFWTGILLILLFSLRLKWLPSSGNDHWYSLILPCCVLAFQSMGQITRTTRSSMLEVIHQDYLRTVRAKGLAERAVIYKHGLRNALIPIFVVVGNTISSCLGGAIICESVFSWPGVGKLIIDAVYNRDTDMLVSATIMTTILISVVFMLIDLMYGFVDPRIKAQYAGGGKKRNGK